MKKEKLALDEQQANVSSRSQSVKHKPLIDAELTVNTQDTQSSPTIFSWVSFKEDTCSAFTGVRYSFIFFLDWDGVEVYKKEKQPKEKANI